MNVKITRVIVNDTPLPINIEISAVTQLAKVIQEKINKGINASIIINKNAIIIKICQNAIKEFPFLDYIFSTVNTKLSYFTILTSDPAGIGSSQSERASHLSSYTVIAP